MLLILFGRGLILRRQLAPKVVSLALKSGEVTFVGRVERLPVQGGGRLPRGPVDRIHPLQGVVVVPVLILVVALLLFRESGSRHGLCSYRINDGFSSWGHNDFALFSFVVVVSNFDCLLCGPSLTLRFRKLGLVLRCVPLPRHFVVGVHVIVVEGVVAVLLLALLLLGRGRAAVLALAARRRGQYPFRAADGEGGDGPRDLPQG
mmetsp:Transcript_57457/g.121948  ORF Transcript_57457/g.121948 Transcript_57457/m.121948 type:complete len:204 (-) Transcript_57457:407-1018(-)